MKKNRGFTLVELLAVIIILAGIALIAFPILLNTIKNSEDKIDGATRKLVISAAKLYVDENLNDYPKKDSSTYCIPFDDLIKSGKLEKGILDAADVNAAKKTVKVTVSDDYNYEIVNNGDCTSKTMICTLDHDSEKPSQTIGAKYTCNVGDGVARTFYVLENGDNTELKKGDFTQVHYAGDMIGTTSPGEISLIMDRNIDDTAVEWGSYDLGPVTVLAHLKSKTAAWEVEVNLPTYDQIYAINDSNSLISSPWLYGNLDDDSNTPVIGNYWTSTHSGKTNGFAGMVECYTKSLTGGTFNFSSGIRPVITISKQEIN